jgi:hypothetical protein
MKASLFCFAVWFFLTVNPSHAKIAPLEGFPSNFEVFTLWESVTVDGRPSRAYRFISKEPFSDVRFRLQQWLSRPDSPAQEVVKNGWTYLSHKKSGYWTSVQFRRFDVELVEGIVSVWQDANEKSHNPFERFERMASLQNLHVIRRVESIDRGRRTLNLIGVGDKSVAALVNGLVSDLKALGLTPATYAPAALDANKQSALQGPQQGSYAAQAWTGAGSQVLLTVFEHKGRTAVQLLFSGGN